MAVALHIPQIETVSHTEALWSLILTQKKSVQKTIAARLDALIANEKTKAQQAYVRKSLTHALKEVREAHASGHSLPDARNLFDELDDKRGRRCEKVHRQSTSNAN